MDEPRLSYPKSTEKKRHYCCVCSNYRGKVVNRQSVSLHRFPADKTLRKAWIRRLRSVETSDPPCLDESESHEPMGVEYVDSDIIATNISIIHNHQSSNEEFSLMLHDYCGQRK
ncbi:hypothetical protein ACF0H5_005590 [Mactra antiquata]